MVSDPPGLTPIKGLTIGATVSDPETQTQTPVPSERDDFAQLIEVP